MDSSHDLWENWKCLLISCFFVPMQYITPLLFKVVKSFRSNLLLTKRRARWSVTKDKKKKKSNSRFEGLDLLTDGRVCVTSYIPFALFLPCWLWVTELLPFSCFFFLHTAWIHQHTFTQIHMNICTHTRSYVDCDTYTHTYAYTHV